MPEEQKMENIENTNSLNAYISAITPLRGGEVMLNDMFRCGENFKVD